MTGVERHGITAVWTHVDQAPRCASCGTRVVLTTDGWRHVDETITRKAS
jgi:ribosomal protein S27E